MSESHGGGPKWEGAFGLQAAVPRLPRRTRRRVQEVLDTDGLSPEERVGALRHAARGRGVRRRVAKAMRSATRSIAGERDRLERERRRAAKAAAKAERESDAVLEHDVNLRFLLGMGTGMAGTALERLRWHETTSARAGVLDPWLAAGRGVLDGPTIGVDAHTGLPFRFDCWSPYRAHLVTSSNMLVAGAMGSGKSMMLKTLALREICWNRRVIVQSDPKGEWASIARAVGGQVVSIAPGSRFNPLAAPTRPSGLDDDEWDRALVASRLQALRSLMAALRPEQPVDSRERTVLDACVHAMNAGQCPATVDGLVSWLSTDPLSGEPPTGLTGREAADSSRSVLRELGHMATGGSIRGFENDEDSVDIAPDAPMLVFDTSSLPREGAARRVFLAAMGAAIDRILDAKDGLFRLVISEEGWEIISDPAQVMLVDRRMRLSGDLACCNILLLHELKDLEKFGGGGSEQRARVEGLLNLATMKVIYRQSAESMPWLERLMPDLTGDERADIPELPVGQGLWRIGRDFRARIHPVMSQEAYALFDTSARRAG